MVNLTQVTEWETCDVTTESGPFLYGGEREEEDAHGALYMLTRTLTKPQPG